MTDEQVIEMLRQDVTELQQEVKEIPKLGAEMRGLGREMGEVKAAVKEVSSGQTTLTRWMIGATFTGLGLVFTLGMWLAERLFS